MMRSRVDGTFASAGGTWLLSLCLLVIGGFAPSAAAIPGATQNLSASAGNTGYRAFRGTMKSTRQIVGSMDCANLGAVPPCTDADVTNGQSYNYLASAIDIGSQGDPSKSGADTLVAATASLSITTTAFNPATATIGVG
ncbi:MAG: hypothetical protein ABI672_11050, partial [Vicinamibacteria bacterium]